MAVKACVFWSLTLKAKSLQKARDYVPRLLAALGDLEFGYDLFADKLPDRYIFATYQNLSATKLPGLFAPVADCAYKLGNGWRMYNLQTLSGKKLDAHIIGSWAANDEATTVQSMLFEISPDTVAARPRPGVWKMKDKPKR